MQMMPVYILFSLVIKNVNLKDKNMKVTSEYTSYENGNNKLLVFYIKTVPAA